MTTCSTERLAESELDQAVKWYYVLTQRSHTTPNSIDNVVYLIVKILVERVDWRW